MKLIANENKSDIIKIILSLLLTFILINDLKAQLAGTYYVNQDGTEDYTSLSAAVSDLNTNGIAAPVTIFVRPGYYSEQLNFLEISGTSLTNTVTFVSSTLDPNQTVLIYNATSSGDNYLVNLKGTDYVTFQSLKFMPNTTGDLSRIFYLELECNDIKLLGCILDGSEPEGGAFDNGGASVFISSGTTGSRLTIQDCIVNNNRHHLYNAASIDVIEILNSNFNNSSMTSIYYGNVPASDSLIVRNSTLSSKATVYYSYGTTNYFEFSKCTLTGGSYVIAIPFDGTASTTRKLHNNFFIGENLNGYVSILSINSHNNIEIYNNTFILKNSYYSSYMFSFGEFASNIEVVNNIFYRNNEGYLVGGRMDGLTNFNFNLFYNTGYFAYLSRPGYSSDVETFNDFQDSTLSNENSHFYQPNFINESENDFHLSIGADGSGNYVGTPIASITDDFDGDARDPEFPYVGADESGFVLPVELSSFTVMSNNGKITLNWSTASESNNAGWEVESRSQKSVLSSQKSGSSVTLSGVEGWTKVGFIPGKGTTTEKNSYQFQVESSKFKAPSLQFRLKQIDTDGKFTYSNILSVDATPNSFELSQNYPNPFNPTTRINFNLPHSGIAKLIVYNILGQTVTELHNGFMESGSHTLEFNANKLSSGLYLYKLEFENKSLHGTMNLIK